MARYYFDTFDNGVVTEDAVGVEFPDLKKARAEALRTLGEIAKDELPDGDCRDFVITIRDHDPEPRLTATLSLRVQTRA